MTDYSIVAYHFRGTLLTLYTPITLSAPKDSVEGTSIKKHIG